MVKKTIIFFATLVIGAVCMDAFAVPSVRQLGTNASTNTEKNVALLPSLPKANPDAIRAAKLQPTKEVDDSARISLGSFRYKQPTPNNQSGGNSSGGNIGGSAGSITGNVQNAITGVVEAEPGNYVTDLSVGTGNKLEVTKSRVLVAPVFQGNSDTGSNAEIWVVR